jgi:hypothetical protein
MINEPVEPPTRRRWLWQRPPEPHMDAKIQRTYCRFISGLCRRDPLQKTAMGYKYSPESAKSHRAIEAPDPEEDESKRSFLALIPGCPRRPRVCTFHPTRAVA